MLKPCWQLLAAKLQRTSPLLPSFRHARCPVLVVVEGTHDICFLRHVSAILHRHDSALPDLNIWERNGGLALLPCGGGDSCAWISCLAPLGLPEFHLLDREVSPTTERREAIIAAINGRCGCYATLTSMRSLENYVHAEAIEAVLKVSIDFGDETPVIENLTEQFFCDWGQPEVWPELAPRSRQRWKERLKRYLHQQVVPRLTVEQITPRDPNREIAGWLRVIADLANG